MRFYATRGLGYVTIRKNTGPDLVNMGRGYCIRLFTDAGSFVRYAGTWRLRRDAIEEAKSLGFGIGPRPDPR